MPAGDGKTSAHFFQARTHVHQAVPAPRRSIGRQSVPVIGDGQAQAVTDLPHGQADFGGAGMMDYIGNGFFEGQEKFMPMDGRHGTIRQIHGPF